MNNTLVWPWKWLVKSRETQKVVEISLAVEFFAIHRENGMKTLKIAGEIVKFKKFLQIWNF